MADLNAILKNKMGLSVEQAKKSKILASLSGSYRQNMKSIHYSQLVPSTNQFYTEKELEDLADIIQILGGVAQNLLVRKKDAEQYEILAGHRRWRASQIVVQRGFPEYAYLPCLVIECNDDVAELLLILTNSSARSDLNGYEQMMQVVRLQELLPKINKDETLKGRILRKEIALSTKRSESTVQNLMFTAKHLSEDGMQAFREEKLTPAAALYLAKQSKEDQKDLVQKEFFTVAAMEGYLASKSVTQEIPSKQPTKEGKRNPNLKPCKTGLSKSGACGSAAYCEAPYSCCKECKKECSLRCGWIREEIDDIPEKHQGPEPYVAVPAEKTESKKVAKKPIEKKEAVKEPEAIKEEAVKADTKVVSANTKKESAQSAPKKRGRKPGSKNKQKEQLTPEVYVQYHGEEVEQSAIIEKIKEQYVSEGHRAGNIKSLKLYLKPEDRAAYFVINDRYAGKVDLFNF